MANEHGEDTKVLTAELSNSLEGEASLEEKALEVASALIAKKFAGEDRVISTVELAGELVAAKIPGVTIDTAAKVLKICARRGYVKPFLQRVAGQPPVSWMVLSAPEVSPETSLGTVDAELEPLAIDLPPIGEDANAVDGETPASVEAAAEDPKELLRRARLAALEKHIESLGEVLSLPEKTLRKH